MTCESSKIESSQTEVALLGLNNRLFEILKPPPRLTVAEWAQEYRELSREANAKGGKWRNLPMQIAPQEDLTNPDVESVTLVFASQTAGKTEILLNAIGYFSHQDPAPILLLQPTLEMAEAFSKDRVAPMMRDTPCLRGLVKDARSRDSGNTVLHKSFPGGHLTMAGANSPASLASRPIRVLLCDEPDRYPESAGAEGDPISLAERRTDTFWNAVKLFASTPTVKGRSRIENLFEQTDKRYWFCPCPRCGHEQTLKWSQVKWTFTENSEEVSDPRRAVYVCESEDCAAHLSDVERVEMIKRGRWIATAPFNGKRGYQLSGLYSLFRAGKGFASRLHQMVADFLKAKAGGSEAMRTWINTFLAETYQSEADKKPEFHILYNRREAYTPSILLPPEVLVIGAGVDAQDDRIEAEAVGFGLGEETWGLEYRVFMGDPRYPQVWEDLDNWLLQKWKHPCGEELGIISTCVDVGAPKTSRMGFEFARRRQARFVWATRGAKPVDFPFFRRAMKTKGTATLIMVGVNRLKSLLYSRMDIKEHGHGYMHFPRLEDGGDACGYSENYFKMLTAEDPFTVYVQGVPYQRFENPGQKRNEALDCRTYATAGFYMRNVNLEKIAKDMAAKMAALKPKEAVPEQEKPEPAPAHRPMQRPIRPRGWVGGWR